MGLGRIRFVTQQARRRGVLNSGGPPVWITGSGRLFRSSPGIYSTVNYSTNLLAENAESYSISSGSLPDGMSLNSSTGEIGGVPTNISDFTSGNISSFVVSATNSSGSEERSFEIMVDSYYVGQTCMAMNENQSSTVTAPSGFTYTRLDFSSYGTPGGSCPNWSIGGCHSGSRPNDLAASSFPQNSISVSALNSWFGDPCGGTVKRYRGTFSYSPIST